jgi:hypothetical protein
MRESQIKCTSHVVKWVSPRGLPTFLLLSFALHLCAIVTLGRHQPDKNVARIYGNIYQALQVRIVGVMQSQSVTSDASTKEPLLNKVDVRSSTVKESAEVQSRTQREPLLPSIPTPQLNPWFRNSTIDPAQLQQAYLQQQRNFVYQQTSMQISSLLSQLTQDFYEDVSCEDKAGALSCTPALSEFNLNLLKTIQQLGRQQQQWQLISSPLVAPLNGIKLTLWL